MRPKCCEPRSGSITSSRSPNIISPTLRFWWMKSRATEAAAVTAVSIVASSPSPMCSLRERSSTTQRCEAGSSSKVFTLSEPVRRLLFQWMRLTLSPGS